MSDERDQHILDLYHALNIALPGYIVEGSFDRENWKEVPPHPASVAEAKMLFHKHLDCCGKVYDLFFQDAGRSIA